MDGVPSDLPKGFKRFDDSTQILGVRFTPKEDQEGQAPKVGTLDIIFRNTPGQGYSYLLVPEFVFDELLQAPSAGSYVGKNITRPAKKGDAPPYQYEKFSVGDMIKALDGQ